MIRIEYGPYSKSPVRRIDIFDPNGKLLRWQHEGKQWNTSRALVQLKGYSPTKNRHDHHPIDWEDEGLQTKLISEEYSLVTSFGKCHFIEQRPILSIDSHFEE